MPRLTKKDRWRHPIYKNAYCYRRTDRGDRVYLSVQSQRTSTNIAWSEANKPIALDALTAYYYEITNPKDDSSKIKTLGLFEANMMFMKDLRVSISDKTFYYYKEFFKKLFTKDYPLSSLLEIKQMIMENFNTIYHNHEKSYKRKVLQAARKFFNYCVDSDFITNNPIKPSLLPKADKKPVLTYSDDQFNAIINEIKRRGNERLLNYIIIASTTALRQAELLNLEWSDISDKAINVKKGKGGNPRIVPLRPFPKAINAFNKLRVLNPNKPVHYSSPESLRNNFNRALNKLEEKDGYNFDGLNYHSLRKYAINKMRDMGIDPENRALISGHSEKVEFESYLLDPDANYFEEYFAKLELKNGVKTVQTNPSKPSKIQQNKNRKSSKIKA